MSTPTSTYRLRLPSPAWWLVSVAVVFVAFVLIVLLDRAKKARFPAA